MDVLCVVYPFNLFRICINSPGCGGGGGGGGGGAESIKCVIERALYLG